MFKDSEKFMYKEASTIIEKNRAFSKLLHKLAVRGVNTTYENSYITGLIKACPKIGEIQLPKDGIYFVVNLAQGMGMQFNFYPANDEKGNTPGDLRLVRLASETRHKREPVEELTAEYVNLKSLQIGPEVLSVFGIDKYGAPVQAELTFNPEKPIYRVKGALVSKSFS